MTVELTIPSNNFYTSDCPSIFEFQFFLNPTINFEAPKKFVKVLSGFLEKMDMASMMFQECSSRTYLP